MQSPRLHIVCKVENPGQSTAVQSSDKNLQTLCAREILHPQKTPPGNPQPPPRNWNLLPPSQNVPSQKHRESESAGPAGDDLNHCGLCLSVLTISMLTSSDDCGPLPHETGL